MENLESPQRKECLRARGSAGALRDLVAARRWRDGEVYEARGRRLDRTVAIKVLPLHLAQDAERRDRFEREARAVAALSHPNICTLHDIGSEADVDYLVMERLEGQTLADRLEKGPLPMDEALRYAVEIADALDRAHREGIVHRVSVDGGAQPMWSHDGRELFYTNGNRFMAVDVSTDPSFDHQTPRMLFERPLPESTPGDPSRYGVSPDGQRFLIISPAEGDEATPPEIHVVIHWFQELAGLAPSATQ